MSNGDRLCPHTPGYADPLEDRHTIYSDIYSIGQVIRDMFEDVVPLGWGAIINRCLSRYWKYRYQSVFELKDEVDHFTDVNRRARVDFSDEVNKEEFHRQDVEKNFAKSVMCTGRLPTDDECEIPYEIIPGVPPRCLETIRRPVGWDEIIQKEPCPDSAGRQRWTIDMMDEDGGHQKIWAQNVLPIAKQKLVLPAGVELEILGPGWLNAEICGRPGSTVILSECVTLHNRVGANKDHAVYVINGGAYLNFCNIKEGSRVAQSVRKRVIQSMTSVSHVRFGGPETLYDLRREVLENSKVLRIPEELRGEVRRCYGFPAKLKSER